MARISWRGNINFGLVNIPVMLEVAETHDRPHFRMLDKSDMSPIKYKLVNANTRDEIPRDQIIKGYEYRENDFVTLTSDDFKKANIKATKTIEIQAFVDHREINPTFFVRPYYVHPGERAEKSYALLREALRKTGKVGIATIVMQAREHLCALMVLEEVIVMELLRYAHEIRRFDKKTYPSSNLKKLGLREGELKMAETLIAEMSDDFHPEQFHDRYQDDLMAFIQQKIKKGKHAKGRKVEPDESVTDQGQVVDFVSLLKKSIDQKGKGRRSHGVRKVQ